MNEKIKILVNDFVTLTARAAVYESEKKKVKEMDKIGEVYTYLNMDVVSPLTVYGDQEMEIFAADFEKLVSYNANLDAILKWLKMENNYVDIKNAKIMFDLT